MAGNNRCTDLEKKKRVLEVAKAILQGYSKRVFLIQYISKKFDWACSDRTIDEYLKEAKNLIGNSLSEEDIVIEKNIAVNRLEDLYTHSFKTLDFRECRNITMDRMKLLGVLIERKDITTDGEKIIPPEIVFKNFNEQ